MFCPNIRADFCPYYYACNIESFRSEKKMYKKLKESFEDFINKDHRYSNHHREEDSFLDKYCMQYFTGGRCASHLASYIDDLLRTGLNGVSEEEVDAKLEKVFFSPPCFYLFFHSFVHFSFVFLLYSKTIVIFKYISDKDVFENYYKNLLSKRLLGGKTGQGAAA